MGQLSEWSSRKHRQEVDKIEDVNSGFEIRIQQRDKNIGEKSAWEEGI